MQVDRFRCEVAAYALGLEPGCHGAEKLDLVPHGRDVRRAEGRI